MRGTFRSLCLALVFGVAPCAASAAVTGFVANASGNSIDLANYVTAAGQTVEHGVNFDSHPIGPVIATYYQGGYGVTLSTSNWDSVGFGLGAVSGSLNPPNSSGEGHLDDPTGYLATGNPLSSVTVTFAAPVLAAGFMTIDYYNASGDNTMTIEAFDGPDGTGTLLGSFTGLSFNFQLNYKYFMGIGSSAQDIRSIRLSTLGLYGDGVLIDEIPFSVPAPGTLAMAACAGAAMARRRR